MYCLSIFYVGLSLIFPVSLAVSILLDLFAVSNGDDKISNEFPMCEIWYFWLASIMGPTEDVQSSSDSTVNGYCCLEDNCLLNVNVNGKV